MEIISGMELSRRMALHSFILQKNVAYDGPEGFILKRRVYKLASLPEKMGGFSKTVFSRFKRKSSCRMSIYHMYWQNKTTWNIS